MKKRLILLPLIAILLCGCIRNSTMIITGKKGLLVKGSLYKDTTWHNEGRNFVTEVNVTFEDGEIASVDKKSYFLDSTEVPVIEGKPAEPKGSEEE